MLPTVVTELLELETLGGRLLVLVGEIVTVLALGALENYVIARHAATLLATATTR
jgi:hypothetical protein